MMRSRSVRSRILSATTALLALVTLFALAGCASDDGALPRSVVHLVSLNENLPLSSDVYNLGADKEKPDDDFIPIDYVEVTVSSRPADPALTMNPGLAFGTVRFDHYSLTWSDLDLNDDGTNDLENLAGPMNLLVPINGTAQGAVLAVPGGWKQKAPLSLLVMGGEYRSNASIILYGEEETSHIKVSLNAGLMVSFADFADETN